MPTPTAADRVRTRASWLAVHAAIATVLTLAVGSAYYFVADDYTGVLLSLPLVALALLSLVVSFVAGFFENTRKRSQLEAKPISTVSKASRERGR